MSSENVPRLYKMSAWVVLFLAVGMLLFFGKYARIERIDNRLEDNVVSGEALDAYYRFQKYFGNDRILLVGFKVPEITPALVRQIIVTEFALLELENVETVLSPVSPLRTQLGMNTIEKIDDFLSEERIVNKYFQNLKKTEAYKNLIISEKWDVGGIVIRLKSEAGDLVGPTIDKIREVFQKKFPFPIQLTGIPEITRLILDNTRKDQKLYSPLTIVFIAIILIILYRSFFGIFVPLLAIILSLAVTKGTMILGGWSINFVTSILPPMILSISLTYCIHLLTEYFQESREEGKFSLDILVKSFMHVSKPIFLSALTTIIGFGSLFYNTIPAISQFGVFSSLGVAVSAIAAILVISAGIIAIRPVGKKEDTIEKLEPLIQWISRTVIQHYKKAWAVVIVFGVISVYGIYILPIETSLIRYLPEDHNIQDANNFVESNLAGIVPIEILLEATGRRFTEPEMIDVVRKIQEEVVKLPFVDKTVSYVDFVQDFDRMFSGEPDNIPKTEEEICDYLTFYVTKTASEAIKEEEAEAEALDENASPTPWVFKPFHKAGLLNEFITPDAEKVHISLRIRDKTSRELVSLFESIRKITDEKISKLPIKANLTGRAMMWAEVSESIAWNEITSFGFSVIVITLVIAIQFWSLKVGLVAMIPNLMPLLYTYGVMGLTGTTFNTVTGMIASIAIGLAVDDTIHIIFYYKSELNKDGNEVEALVRTVVHKGRATCFASFVLCGGFFPLILSSFAPTRYFGIFITFGVSAALACELFITPIALYTFKVIPIPNIVKPDGLAVNQTPERKLEI
ncbi:MAG: MMPL family transporter [Candidatus Riflebacteria bacterium]|nr:MMPL family transporter [Candidatus Riflebacteria bacterium]